MKQILIFIAITAFSSSLDWETELLKEDPIILTKFNDFMYTYQKSYGSLSNMLAKLQVFKQNLIIAEYLNELDSEAEYGITKFSDLTQEEFAAKYLTLKQSDTEFLQNLEVLDTTDIDIEDAPDSYDWRDHGAVTKIKDQGQCGSCTFFSAVANLEGQYFLKNNELLSFSEQQLVDCEHLGGDSGCDGGRMLNSFEWWETNGFELESDYPYNAKNGKCKQTLHKSYGNVVSFVKLSQKESVQAASLSTMGPLSAAVNANKFQHYNKGILDPPNCDIEVDHGVTLVGYGTEDKDFWIIKNSWGEDWGENGYIRLKRNSGTCGINRAVSTITSLK